MGTATKAAAGLLGILGLSLVGASGSIEASEQVLPEVEESELPFGGDSVAWFEAQPEEDQVKIAAKERIYDECGPTGNNCSFEEYEEARDGVELHSYQQEEQN